MTDFPGVLFCFLFFYVSIFLCSHELLTPLMTPDDPPEFFRNALVEMCYCSEGKYGQAKLIHDEG
jgi:hypothetical protein